MNATGLEEVISALALARISLGGERLDVDEHIAFALRRLHAINRAAKSMRTTTEGETA